MVNVREFYAEDPRRQESEEVTFGLEWRDDEDEAVRYGLHWIEDTREIYVMRQVPGLVAVDPRYGAFNVSPGNEALQVELLGWAEDRQAIERALDGWRSHMGEPNSLQWVRDRLEDAAALTLRERDVDAGGIERWPRRR